MVRVDALYVPTDRETVADLLAALANQDLEIHEPSESPTDNVPLVVLITPAMLEPQNVAYAEAVASRYQEVLPVSFLPGAAPLFADLSQSLISQLGVSECARRIALIATHGGRTIVDWNNLVSKAIAWRTDGRQALLPDADANAALSLLQSPPAQSSSNRALVAEYVAASQSALARRRRIGTAVVAVSCAILAAILVFASIQAISARKAQVRARDTGNAATANRLARLAIESLGGNPDLPGLLANRALSFANTPTALEAETRAVAATWPHKSYKLDFVPYGLSAASQSSRIAINDSDHNTMVLFDQPGGKKLGEFRYASDARPVGVKGKLSPDGRRLAVKLPASMKLFDVDSKEQLAGPSRWYRGNDALIDWLDNDRVLVGRGPQVLAVNPETGEATPIADVGSAIAGGSLSPNRQHLVVETERGVSIVNPVTNQHERSIDSQIASPAIGDDGQTIVGLQHPYAVEVGAPDAGGKNKLTRLPGAGNVLLPLDNGYTLALAANGELSVISGEKLYDTVKGHLSGRVRGARLSDGKIGTVGEDGFLRVWSIPDFNALRGKPISSMFIPSRVRQSRGSQMAGPRESARNQIRMSGDDTLAATVLPGATWLLTLPDLVSDTKKPFFAGMDSDVFLSRNGSYVASVGDKFVRTDKVGQSSNSGRRDSANTMMNSRHIQMAIGKGGKGIGAVSDDGSTVVLADEYSVSSRHTDAANNRDAAFEQDRRPVALYAEPNGNGYALTVDGYLRSSDGAESKLDLPGADAHAAEVAAAEFLSRDDYVLATRDGRLMHSKSNSLKEVANVGGGNDSFALRTSTDGSQIALIGATGLVVYDVDAHHVVYREPGYGTDNDTLLTDVTFTKQRGVLYGVTQVGGVRRIEFAKDLHDELATPRQFSADELALFQISEN